MATIGSDAKSSQTPPLFSDDWLLCIADVLAKPSPVLDLRSIVQRGHRHKSISPHGVALLTNLILTSPPGDAVRVFLPPSSAARKQLARGGLYLAIANRPVELVLDNEVLHLQGFGSIPMWRQDWTPLDAQFRGRLFGPLQDENATDPAEIVQEELVTFINPHRALRGARTSDLSRNDIGPWLWNVVGGREGFTSLDALLSNVAWAVDELLENVAEHAFDEQTLRSRNLPDGRFSLIQIFRTRGGRRSHSRLHVLAFDTGIGIPKSARATRSEVSDWTDEMIVTTSLRGSLPRYGRGKGLGLRNVGDIAEMWNGALLVSTQSASSTRSSLHVSAGEDLDVVRSPLPIQGTVVTLTLSLAGKERDAATASRTSELGQNEGQLVLESAQ